MINNSIKSLLTMTLVFMLGACGNSFNQTGFLAELQEMEKRYVLAATDEAKQLIKDEAAEAGKGYLYKQGDLLNLAESINLCLA